MGCTVHTLRFFFKKNLLCRSIYPVLQNYVSPKINRSEQSRTNPRPDIWDTIYQRPFCFKFSANRLVNVCIIKSVFLSFGRRLAYSLHRPDWNCSPMLRFPDKVHIMRVELGRQKASIFYRKGLFLEPDTSGGAFVIVFGWFFSDSAQKWLLFC